MLEILQSWLYNDGNDRPNSIPNGDKDVSFFFSTDVGPRQTFLEAKGRSLKRALLECHPALGCWLIKKEAKVVAGSLPIAKVQVDGPSRCSILWIHENAAKMGIDTSAVGDEFKKVHWYDAKVTRWGSPFPTMPQPRSI